jgi:AraC-like DNA-binding protein
MSTITFPASDLSGRVDFCWSTRRPGGIDAAFGELLPDSGVHLVFRFSPATSGIYLVGPATERPSIELERDAEYVGFRFRTAQAPRFADVRAAELADRFIRLDRIVGRTAESLADQLRGLPDDASRQHVIEDVVRRTPAPLVEDRRCRAGALALERSAGRMRVQELGSELGVHARTLERAFLNELGITPKRLVRLVRLREVLGALRARRFRTLAEVAHDCGYSDQSHMNRDLKDLTGRVPGETDAFLARPLGTAETRLANIGRT